MCAEDDARAHIVMGVDGVERLHRQEPPTVRDRTTRGRRALSGDGEGNALRLTMSDDGSHLIRTSRDDQPLRVASRVRGVGQVSLNHIGVGDDGQVAHAYSLFRDQRHGLVCEPIV